MGKSGGNGSLGGGDMKNGSGARPGTKTTVSTSTILLRIFNPYCMPVVVDNGGAT